MNTNTELLGREVNGIKQEVLSYQAFKNAANDIMSEDYSVDHVIFVLGYNDLKEGRDSATILRDARESLQIARCFFFNARFIISEVVALNNSRFFKRELDLLNCGLEELSSNNHLVTFSPHPILSPNDHQHLFHKDGTHLTLDGEAQLTSDLRRAAKGIQPLPHPIKRGRNPIQDFPSEFQFPGRPLEPKLIQMG